MNIEYLFKQKPELSQIGSIENYKEYIKTIFPESSIPYIVYHGTSLIFDKFTIRINDTSVPYACFSDSFDFAKKFSEERVSDRGGTPVVYLCRVNNGSISEYDDFDSIISNEIIVYNDKDIHLLGSEYDIISFKIFMKNHKLLAN